jgi:hypothetical protein
MSFFVGYREGGRALKYCFLIAVHLTGVASVWRGFYSFIRGDDIMEAKPAVE